MTEDERTAALAQYGWTKDEDDNQYVSAKHSNTVVILGTGNGWQVRMVEEEEVMLIGNSRYQTRLGDWLHRLEEPQPAREA